MAVRMVDSSEETRPGDYLLFVGLRCLNLMTFDSMVGTDLHPIVRLHLNWRDRRMTFLVAMQNVLHSLLVFHRFPLLV